MKTKFSLFFLVIPLIALIFLIYPQVSSAAITSVTTNAASTGLTSVTLSGTIDIEGASELYDIRGFNLGTASANGGQYNMGSSSDTGGPWAGDGTFTHATTTDLSKGTLYYFRAYAASSTAEQWVYGSERTFLTGVDVPASFSTQSLTDRIKLAWTAGTGAEKTMIRYNDGTTYPTLITGGEQAYWGSGAEVTLYNLPSQHTYYFSAWSSTSDAGLTTTTDSYVEIKAATIFTASGGLSRVAPTTYADSLVINQGAATTQTREVTLKLKASDASYMSICNDNLFLGPLENYATTKSWTLTEEDGIKTVYVKFTSPDGVNSGVVSAVITLKTVAETPAPVTPTPVTPAPVTPEPTPTPIAPTPIETPVTTPEAISGCTITSFNRNLRAGMSGNDVKCLQVILNSLADTKIAASGAGSLGNETTYFGSLTKAAVIKFQEKYASGILATYGLTKGTGVVSTNTRAKLNELLGK